MHRKYCFHCSPSQMEFREFKPNDFFPPCIEYDFRNVNYNVCSELLRFNQPMKCLNFDCVAVSNIFKECARKWTHTNYSYFFLLLLIALHYAWPVLESVLNQSARQWISNEKKSFSPSIHWFLIRPFCLSVTIGKLKFSSNRHEMQMLISPIIIAYACLHCIRMVTLSILSKSALIS